MIKPIKQRVLVELVNTTKEKQGLIYIPESANNKEKIYTGKILEVGNIENCEVKKGDTVLFTKYSGVEVNKNTLMIAYSDILAIANEEKERENFYTGV